VNFTFPLEHCFFFIFRRSIELFCLSLWPLSALVFPCPHSQFFYFLEFFNFFLFLLIFRCLKSLIWLCLWGSCWCWLRWGDFLPCFVIWHHEPVVFLPQQPACLSYFSIYCVTRLMSRSCGPVD
jgi:hypothetical protein